MSDQNRVAKYGSETHHLSLFHEDTHLYLCISPKSINHRGDCEVTWEKQSCKAIANVLLISLFGCTHTPYFQGSGEAHGGMLPSQWEAGLLVSAHKNPSLLQMPLHRSVGVLLELLLQCILTTLRTLPSSSKQPNLHAAAVKTKQKESKEERKSSSSTYIGEKVMMNASENSQWSRIFSSFYYNLKWLELE